MLERCKLLLRDNGKSLNFKFGLGFFLPDTVRLIFAGIVDTLDSDVQADIDDDDACVPDDDDETEAAAAAAAAAFDLCC